MQTGVQDPARTGLVTTDMADMGLLVLKVFGRQREVMRVVQILGRRLKNNPILLGEAGVGKVSTSGG